MRSDANSRAVLPRIRATGRVPLLALLLVLGGCGTEKQVPEAPPSTQVPAEAQAAPDHPIEQPIEEIPHTFVETRELAAVADTFVARSVPNRNEGWALALKTGAPAPYRTLVAFEPDGIAVATENRELLRAILRLTSAESDYKLWRWGRVLNLHRMNREWSEKGATWECAEDSNTANDELDCPEDRLWGMSGRDQPRPWETEPSASVLVGMGETGPVSFNVTEDLLGFLSGAHGHHGWLVTKRGDMRQEPGEIAFYSRETGNVPVLALTVRCDDADDDTVCNVEDNCPTASNTDQENFDLDEQGDTCDPDDDNDLVDDLGDPQPMNAMSCGDSDNDTCDDCIVAGRLAPANDGIDTDVDGLCDLGDPDDDNDTIADASDRAPLDPHRCADSDRDLCDDCRVAGRWAPANDGLDTDTDGLCNIGDPDDDNDTIADASDPDPLDAAICGDSDSDTCDDCSVALRWAPADDGLDTDTDGLCDAGDPDDDNDNVADASDPQPLNPAMCGDSDHDTCDDCVIALQWAPANDGPDLDTDGLCDAGDPDDDNDNVVDVSDPQPMDPAVCGDSDRDSCDDCGIALRHAPDNDGPDADSDGLCDVGDPDDDNDDVPDVSDPQPMNPAVCGDSDGDTCDDCSVAGRKSPGNDGLDTDSDGLCDAGDADDDGDTVPDVSDPAPRDPAVCGDSDRDSCDDCAVMGRPQPANDGPDADRDGVCDAGEIE